ncbi:MAG: plasmid recombination protein [Oscillospiraceae bacterium]|nr:plasmid recombination protein [Oscillospiraceae bacterium]
MKKTNFTVVRNAAYTASSIEVRERHNERDNENYYNADIVPERKDFNIHYKKNFSPDGEPETYQKTFNRMIDDGVIVKRGLRADAKVFDELIFDVNTNYFDENGGYDYAKKFYEEAYRLAIKEVGGEQYILSAVMHADERNSALSDKLGRDVYHYHLHVVYVPVVEKQILWTKKCKDPALVGKVKEVITQISHSKKWPRFKDESGKWVNSYSLLQDRFFEHMKSARFEGFERGERGSTAEHLDVLDYKIQQDRKEIINLSEQKETQQTELNNLVTAVKVRKDISATHDEIDKMAKPGKSGNNVVVANADWKKVSEMAKRCEVLDAKITDLNKQIVNLKQDRDKWKTNYTRLWDEVKDFIQAIRRFPSRLLNFIREQLRVDPVQTKNKPHEI